MKPVYFLRMLIEKIFSVLANLRTFFTHGNEKAAKIHYPQSLAFAASAQTHICTPLTPTFFFLRTIIK
jgi:hypothetical protein